MKIYFHSHAPILVLLGACDKNDEIIPEMQMKISSHRS